MENKIILITGLVTSIISLITALISFIDSKKDSEIPAINVKGTNNSVTQDNSTHTSSTHIEHKQVTYVSSTNSSSSNDDGFLMIFGMVILLFFLYKNRIILLKVIYIPLIISVILSTLICIFYLKGLNLTLMHPYKTLNIIFTFIPAIISILFAVQNKLFLFDILSIELTQIELVQKLQIGTTILFNYLGIFLLLFAQLSVLIVSYVKFPKLKKIMMEFSHLWPIAVILPVCPIIIWFLQRSLIRC